MTKKGLGVSFVLVLTLFSIVFFVIYKTREQTFPYYAKAIGSFVGKHQQVEKAYYTGISGFYNNLVVELETDFLNYGYLDSQQIPSAVSLQQMSVNQLRTDYYQLSKNLLHKLVEGQQLGGKSILDVGCGKGGMTHYLYQQYKPNKLLGIDISQVAIDMAKAQFTQPGLNFKVGNAMELPVANNSQDVVINIESSNAYLRMEKFYQEVFRVLKPGGQFLYTDLHPYYEIDYYEQLLHETGFIIEKEIDITKNVVFARDYFHNIHDKLAKLQPVKDSYWQKYHKIHLEITAIEGSNKYHDLKDRKLIYKIYQLKKPEISDLS